MTGGARWLALLLAAFAGCRVGGVTTVPLDGPVPSSVIVLPPHNSTVMPDRDVRALATGADVAVRERGYRVLPLGVGFDLAHKYGFEVPGDDAAAGLRRLQHHAGIDAVLTIDVLVWDVDGERRPLSASWDLEWRLVATADAGQLWRYRLQGNWHAAAAERLDPLRAPDAEPEVVPIGGLRRPDYRSASELLLALHRTAMARLPQRYP